MADLHDRPVLGLSHLLLKLIDRMLELLVLYRTL
jgi:hypothetical protein